MKKTRKKPISKKVLFPMGVLIVIDILVLIGSIFGGGLIAQLENNSKDILSERVINRSYYLENQMISTWSNISSTAEHINQIAAQMIYEGEFSVDNLDDSSENSAQFIMNISEDLISMMRSNRVTGAFVVLNTDDLRELRDIGVFKNKPGIYLRDLDPVSSFTSRNRDLLLEYAPTSVVQNLNISTDSAWRPQFEFYRKGEYSDFLFQPYQAAYEMLRMSDINIYEFGYWSQPYELYGDDKSVISYSVPLVLSDGTVYGVMGVELTLEYLKSQIPYNEIVEDGIGSYLLAVEKNGDLVLDNVLINGPAYAQMSDASDTTVIVKEGADYAINIPDGEKMYCAVEYFDLYNSNTPFSEQRWVLVGIVNYSGLFAFSNQILLTLMTSIAITLLAGIGGSIIISVMISRPITALGKSVENIGPSEIIELERTGITEVDLLAESIENLSREVLYSANRFNRIINMTGIKLAVFEINRNEKVVFCTKKFFEILNLKTTETGAMSVDDFRKIMDDLEPFKQPAKEKNAVVYKIPAERDGGAECNYIKITIWDDESCFVGLVEDITSAILELELIEHERDHDLLTGLMNRRAFYRVMKELFDLGPRVLKVSALVMMDLDNLKYVNDTYGHDYGDKYIISAADCFSTYTPDSTVVSRISGDEFHLFFYGYNSKDEIRREFSRLKDGIDSRTIALPDDDNFRIRASGGVAWYPDDSTSYEMLMRYSDFAMYKVKQSVKGELSDFDFGIYNREAYLLQNKAELTELIEKQAVEYYFQPIAKADTGEIFAYEALMRSQMPTLRMPQEIFAVARQESKLDQMEELTWLNAVKTYSEWVERGEIPAGTKVFINSIANHILTAEKEAEIVQKYKKYLKDVVLEITEEEELEEEICAQKKAILKRWGAQIALDDYGSGYNSEKTLLSLAPQFIKVDISIISNIDTDPDKQELVANITAYAHERNMQVIAEGVETSEEAVTVIRIGVDYLQGYFLAKPAFKPPKLGKNVRRLIEDKLQNDGESEKD